ncbi:MAG TPA: glutamine--tRNA ligase/YqeY domain fusion protein [Burkholderiales bacterium]|nr:glutamine--tRNA ligase/YqeY domain fusion protein [Burkholderiales bacterium]
MPTPSADSRPESAPRDFIREIASDDLAAGKHRERVITRFPPEPNGYLHIGHAKAICIDFGIAQEFGGRCNLRFDDTNPLKESQEYVDQIMSDIRWLGFDWGEHLYYASDYFDFMYEAAEYLIRAGHAYVDESSAEEIRAGRGNLTEPGIDSPFRDRAFEQSLARLREMRDGLHPDASMVLRAKIDMASPNINLRDPILYRVRKATHHRTGDKWCIYPMYTFAHPIEDALENVTHSLCTLEFEDQRPFYDWLLERLAEGGLLLRPVPQQIEFARLNLTYVVLSKRKLIQLIEEKRCESWDDPRMPTLAGARRRGYTPEGFRLFAERIGVSKAESWIEYSVLEDAMREDLNVRAERRIAVLDPVKLVIDNYPEGQQEECFAPNHPQKPELGKRPIPLTRELWIERDDFTETPPKGYFRLFPGNNVRLRYGYVVKCTGCDKDAEGNVTAVHCEYLPDTKSGTPGAEQVKVKGNIHWLSVPHAREGEVRLYDRLFRVPHPGREADFLDDLNPDSKRVITAQLEPALMDAQSEERFQFERHGYFCADRRDSKPGAPVFNRALTLRDSWGAGQK